MGRSPTDKPARLAGKLTQIRKSMDLSQAEMVRTLRLEKSLSREDVSKYDGAVDVVERDISAYKLRVPQDQTALAVHWADCP